MRRRSEEGYIVVEAIFSFTIYIFAVMFIILLTNLYIVHNKVQFAINSAATQLSAYSYLYELSEFRAGIHTVNTDGATYKAKLKDVTDSISDAGALFSSISGGDLNASIDNYNTFKSSAPKAYDAIKNPKDLGIGFLYKIFEDLTQAGLNLLTRSIVEAATIGYLGTDDMSGKEYLQSYGVVDGKLDFSDTKFVDNGKTRIIDVVVKYEVEIPYLKLFGVNPRIPVTNRACVSPWLDGDNSADKLANYKGN